MTTQTPTRIKKQNHLPPTFRKRDGTISNFDPDKIASAIFKAASVVGGKDHKKSEELAQLVGEKLYNEFTAHGSIPSSQDCDRIVPEILETTGYDGTAAAFRSYAKDRKESHQTIEIMGGDNNGKDITDQMLLITSPSQDSSSKWDRSKISDSLKNEYQLSDDLAKSLAKEVENDVLHLYKGGYTRINTSLIRKFAEVRLMTKGIPVKEGLLSIPKDTLESLVGAGSKENSNINSNNPEAVNLGIAEYILKQYNLQNIFSEDVANAHNTGMVHIHDLGYPQRVYCSSHSVEFIKKFGLGKIVANLQNKSSPAKSAMVLNGHMQTFLASMQANYAGALGFGYLNILYAPLLNLPHDTVDVEIEGKQTTLLKTTLDDMMKSGQMTFDENESDKLYIKNLGESKKISEISDKEMKQVAQNLIFSASQNAFSRGGQTLFIDFNLNTGVPEYLENVPVIGPGGKYVIEDKEGNVELVDEVERFQGKKGASRNGDVIQPKDGRKVLTYGDPRMVKTAQKFAIKMMEVWHEGDLYGRQFAFPKCDLHVGETTFTNPDELEVFKVGCDLASKNGSTYFMFDRDSTGATLAQCCRLKEKVTDMDMLKRPESIRFTGFQNVTVNLPQAAYKSDKSLEGTLKNIDAAMEVAVKAHLQKKDYIQVLLDTDGTPLRSLGKECDDGEKYVDLNKSTYIIGLIGLNETVEYITGQQLHESKEAYETGLKVIDRMFQNIQRFKKDYGLKFTLEESPAESATHKLAKGDLARFPEAKKVIKGDLSRTPFYTNSIHLYPGAEISMIDRIEMQSKFHEMIESGAITHVYCGEHQIPSDSIANLVKKTFESTRTSQITISPEFTHCTSCHTNFHGFTDECGSCGSPDVKKRTKIVGYFSDQENWNPAQLEISKAREEVADRYAELSPATEWLYNGNDSKKVMVFGMDMCQACEVAKEGAKNALDSGLGEEVGFEFHDMSTTQGRINAAMTGVAHDPIPTVVFKDNGTTKMYEPDFRKGKVIMREPKFYESLTKQFFANTD